ncbi:MAG: L,D-transpeptidase family protein, partial [Deltaproteobacteria bacterium]|nr:L,D-transpeptidase family protein [Deltaproteobacteria bacterium]
MEKDDRGPRVSALRSRLIASGDLDGSPERDYDLFDEALEWGVRRFQKRHGLKVDGIVGSRTLKTLNVPVEERMRQIELNMERWRWLPNDLGRRFILVNIPNFELYVVENDEILMTMRAVVGRRYQRTPVFTGEMTYLELNPYWHIPTKIATQDILPSIRKNPNYLIKKKIRVFQSWEAQAPEIDPESIDWSQITTENFSFKLRQEPGPSNALGRVKFMFPNRFAVYLHDTPARKLFQKTRRTFSAGCIRIEKPVEL